MSKRLILAFIGLLLVLSFHLYSAKPVDLQSTKEQVAQAMLSTCKLVDEGKFAEASALIETIITENTGNPDIPEALYWVAERYRWAHKWQEAKDLYQYIKSNHPKSDFVSWANLGLAKIDVLSALYSRDLTKAQDELDELIADFHDHPDTPETLYWLARGFGYAERHNTEKLIYEAIVEDYPESPFVQKAKLGAARANVQSLIASGQTDEAKKAIEKMKKDFASHPDLQDAIYWIGERYEWAYEYDSAIAMYQNSIDINADSAIAEKARISYAKTNIKSLIWAKKNKQAKKALDELISDFNGVEIPYEELEWLAERYEVVGEVNTAHNMFEQIVQECSPREDSFVLAKAHLNKYALFNAIESGDKNKVQEMIQQIDFVLSNADSEPNLLVCRENKVDLYLRTISQVCYNRGWALKTSGNVSKAKDYFAVDVAVMERLFTEFPNSSLAPSGVFCAAVVSGQELDDYGKAADYFQKIADDWPNYEYADLSQLKVGDNLVQMVKHDLLPAEQTKPAIIDAYQAVIDKYPQSKYAQSAAVRMKNFKQ